MIEQRSKEWFLARLGNFSGSSISKLMGSGKKKDEIFSKTALTYIYKIASERMLSKKVFELDEMWDMYQDQVGVWSKAIQFGIDWEDDAKKYFTKVTGIEISEVSSVTHPDIPHFSASPDGMFEVEEGFGVVEIKCPLPSTYIEYSAGIKDAESLKVVQPDYYWQMMAEMSVTGAKFGYFITFSPFMKKPIHYAMIERNEDDVNALLERVKLANIEVDKIIEQCITN